LEITTLLGMRFLLDLAIKDFGKMSQLLQQCEGLGHKVRQKSPTDQKNADRLNNTGMD
jgi:hypothetical protein